MPSAASLLWLDQLLIVLDHGLHDGDLMIGLLNLHAIGRFPLRVRVATHGQLAFDALELFLVGDHVQALHALLHHNASATMTAAATSFVQNMTIIHPKMSG